MDEQKKKQRIVYIDKPQFSKPDPNDPIKYVLKPGAKEESMSSMAPSEAPKARPSFMKLKEQLKKPDKKQNAPVERESELNMKNSPDEDEMADFLDRNQESFNNPEIHGVLNQMRDDEYTPEQIKEIQEDMTTRDDYSNNDRDLVKQFFPMIQRRVGK